MGEIIKLIKTFSKKCSLFIEKIVESMKAFYTKQTLVIANKFKYPLIRFWGKSIFWYCFIIVGFAYLFQNFGSLCSNNLEIDTFFDCLYFSVITFHTIGYGDIIPNSDLTKKFIIIESITSVIYTGLFVGYLIYHLQKNDLDRERKPILDIARGNLFKIVNDFTCDFIPRSDFMIFRPTYFDKIRRISTFDLNIESEKDLKSFILLDFAQGIKNYIQMKNGGSEEYMDKNQVSYYEKYYNKLNTIEYLKNALNSFLQTYYAVYIDELKDVTYILNEVDEYLDCYPKIKDFPFNHDDDELNIAIGRIAEIVKKAILLRALLIKKYGLQNS